MLKTWLLEFLQNFPLTLAFIYGYAQYSDGKLLGAVVTALLGTAAGVLIIRTTEPVLAGSPVEDPAETISNFILFGTAILIAIPYFHWPGGSWPSDLALGGALGALAALAQARAAHSPVSPPHTAALAAASAAAFLLLRYWALQAPPLAAAGGLAVLITSVIVPIEYRRR